MATELIHELARKNAELSTRVEELSTKLAHNEALTQLAAGTVHDLRNVLQVTLMAAQSLLEEGQPGDKRELAQMILNGAEHGTLLAQDLLTLARRSPAGQTRCRDLLPRLQRLVERVACKRFECSFDISPRIDTIGAEPAQLEAVLINLCVNARDAMPAGGSLHISVKSLPEDEAIPAGLAPRAYAQFSVKDTGHGMTDDVLRHATEAFFTTKQGCGGTGLGLAMAHAFAARCGGALHIDSEPGRGTCVRLIVPRVHKDQPSARRPDVQITKMLRRIRSPELRCALQAWCDVCPAAGLPSPVAVEARLLRHAPYSLVLGVVPGKEPQALRLLRMGSLLLAALELVPPGEGDPFERDAAAASNRRRVQLELSLDGPVLIGSLEAAYRRSLLSQFPSYEYLRYGAAEGEPDSFERLILPAAASGNQVSHLYGVINLHGHLDHGASNGHD